MPNPAEWHPTHFPRWFHKEINQLLVPTAISHIHEVTAAMLDYAPPNISIATFRLHGLNLQQVAVVRDEGSLAPPGSLLLIHNEEADDPDPERINERVKRLSAWIITDSKIQFVEDDVEYEYYDTGDPNSDGGWFLSEYAPLIEYSEEDGVDGRQVHLSVEDESVTTTEVISNRARFPRTPQLDLIFKAGQVLKLCNSTTYNEDVTRLAP
jgi:hypothetical protein